MLPLLGGLVSTVVVPALVTAGTQALVNRFTGSQVATAPPPEEMIEEEEGEE